MKSKELRSVDSLIVDCIERANVDIICSVPCNMLAGILSEIDRRHLVHIPVCREEEGVGIAAGAALAGKNPLVLMQNSGLGNAINALASLTKLYGLPLFLLMSHRGGSGEQIVAQVPMGKAAPKLLRALSIDFITVEDVKDITLVQHAMKTAYRENKISGALLSRELWR